MFITIRTYERRWKWKRKREWKRKKRIVEEKLQSHPHPASDLISTLKASPNTSSKNFVWVPSSIQFTFRHSLHFPRSKTLKILDFFNILKLGYVDFTTFGCWCSSVLTLFEHLIVIGTTQEALASEVKIKVQNKIQRFLSFIPHLIVMMVHLFILFEFRLWFCRRGQQKVTQWWFI